MVPPHHTIGARDSTIGKQNTAVHTTTPKVFRQTIHPILATRTPQL
jgi:hypothetical protein